MKKIVTYLLLTLASLSMASATEFPAATMAIAPSNDVEMVYTTSSARINGGRYRGNASFGSTGGYRGNASFGGGSMAFTASTGSSLSFASVGMSRGNLSAAAIHQEISSSYNLNRNGGTPPARRFIHEDDDDPPIGVEDPISPIGDALLPLLLLAVMYGIWTLRKRKAQI